MDEESDESRSGSSGSGGSSSSFSGSSSGASSDDEAPLMQRTPASPKNVRNTRSKSNDLKLNSAPILAARKINESQLQQPISGPKSPINGKSPNSSDTEDNNGNSDDDGDIRSEDENYLQHHQEQRNRSKTPPRRSLRSNRNNDNIADDNERNNVIQPRTPSSPIDDVDRTPSSPIDDNERSPGDHSHDGNNNDDGSNNSNDEDDYNYNRANKNDNIDEYQQQQHQQQQQERSEYGRSTERNQSISPARHIHSNNNSRESSVSSNNSINDDAIVNSDNENLKTDDISDGDIDSDRDDENTNYKNYQQQEYQQVHQQELEHQQQQQQQQEQQQQQQHQQEQQQEEQQQQLEQVRSDRNQRLYINENDNEIDDDDEDDDDDDDNIIDNANNDNNDITDINDNNDHDNENGRPQNVNNNIALNINHEYLSDISESDDDSNNDRNINISNDLVTNSDDMETDTNVQNPNDNNGEYKMTDLRHKLDKKKHLQLKNADVNNFKDNVDNTDDYVEHEIDFDDIENDSVNHNIYHNKYQKQPNDEDSNLEYKNENINHIINEKTSPVIVTQNIEIINDILEKKNDEDALDFEAEEGECNEIIKEDKIDIKKPTTPTETTAEKKESDGEVEEGEELEEGEVTDEDEKRPEENEPKPICRFFTRGQCTWGMSCRFLHPGVTDKGNYTMFDMIRPVPISQSPHIASGGGGAGMPLPYGTQFHDYRNERPPIMHHQIPPVHHPAYGTLPTGNAHVRPPIVEPESESAWERGLRTAKEMLRKSIKRKAQDIDFEDKKMNLSASQDELEKDNYYQRDRGASPDSSVPYVPPVRPHIMPPFEDAFNPQPKYPPQRGPMVPFDEDPYGRSIRYRELPPHRMPQYEDEVIMGKRRARPVREVIVQRVEPVNRGDEWNDPWMRSKSPIRGADKRSRRGAAGVSGGGHGGGDRQSFSSNTTYSTSSSSRSGSSSESSRTPSPNTRNRRYNSGHSGHHKSPPAIQPTPPIVPSLNQIQRRHIKRSPSPKRGVIISNRHSPGMRRSPINTRKRSPQIPDKRTRNITPPVAKRKRVSPTAIRKVAAVETRRKKRSSSSASGSSESSGSDTGSSYSSSSSSSAHVRVAAANKVSSTKSRDKLTLERKPTVKKVEIIKKRSPAVVIPETKSSISVPINASMANTAAPASVTANKKITRREELLKQLRAVEDAIARKRSKLN